MSSRADAAFEDYFQRHLGDCARDIVVGAKVYRPGSDETVEEGEVIRVTRCNLRNGSPVETPEGEHTYYIARFRHDVVGQTYQHRWFVSRQDAVNRLVDELREEILDLQREHQRVVDRKEAAIKALTEGVS